MATIIALKVNKTDKNDARLIADAMRCNLYKEVYHKTKESIEIGVLMRTRRTLVNTRTRYKNSIRGFLKALGIRLGLVSHDKFFELVQTAIADHSEIIKRGIVSLLKVYEETCKNMHIPFYPVTRSTLTGHFPMTFRWLFR